MLAGCESREERMEIDPHAKDSGAPMPNVHLGAVAGKGLQRPQPGYREPLMARTWKATSPAPRQTGNDTQSRSEHPQDHPQSKPEHRNPGAERTQGTNVRFS